MGGSPPVARLRVHRGGGDVSARSSPSVCSCGLSPTGRAGSGPKLQDSLPWGEAAPL